MPEIPSDLAEWIAKRIVDFGGDTGEPDWLRSFVNASAVLPLLIDWTAFWGIRADGEIILVDTEDGNPPAIETDSRIRRIALFQGAKKYPQLAPLLPKRPDSARNCPYCQGSGEINVEGVAPGVIYCHCGGSGWLDQREPDPH